MSRTSRGAGLVLALSLSVALAMVVVPIGLIRPFAAQSPGAVALSFALRRWSPWVTLAALAAGLFAAVAIFRAPTRWFSRAAAVLVCVVTAATAWLSRQDYFEWMFRPLPDARFVGAPAASFVERRDMVLAVLRNEDAAAYPVRQLAYHHLVNDSLGGVPIVATY
jgi:uncharacterized protein DUF3179